MHQLDDQPFLAAAAGMDPRSIPGLQLYTDAYALNGSLGYLDSVASWPDWSGLNRTVEQSVGGSQPRFLPWSAAEGNYLHLPAVVGNFASTPDSAAVSVLGDIDIRRHLAPVAWSTGASNQDIAAKWDTGNLSYLFRLNSNGTLRFITTADGTTSVNAQSTAAVGFSAGSKGWIRVTRDVDNGAGGNTTRFFTSTDGVTWTQLGDAVRSCGRY
jgi:hypothetical protein